MPPNKLSAFSMIACMAFLLGGCASPALWELPQPKGAVAELMVQVEGIQQTDGFIVIAIYHHPQAFLKRPYDVGLVAIVDGTAVRPFSLPVGHYAVLAFQDKNSNGKFDRYWFGLPKEPFTYSGKRRQFGPPNWEDSNFELLASGRKMHLHMPN